jgi:hypothetical protein
MNSIGYTYLKIAFAFEGANGQLLINGCVGVCEDTVILHHGGELVVTALEDESSSSYLLRGGLGANPTHAVFIGASVQNSRPANDELVTYLGSLTCIGCQFLNASSSAPPIINLNGIRTPTFPGALALINCFFANATASGTNSDFVRDGANDVIKLGDGKLTMVGCVGGVIGTGICVQLPTIVPAQTRWEKTVVGLDEASIAAGGVSAIHAVGVPGALLGDLVEASFSADLQGMQLNAWVSDFDVVNYQFYNPRGGAIDLGSGTVKVRVKK